MKRFEIFHHIDQSTIDQMFDNYAPVFILSTGRTGTKLMTKIFSHYDQIDAHHEAFPMLQYFPNYIYHNQENSDMLKGMFLAARMELILNAFNNYKTYIESNQCLVFYAYIISNLFKKAKFIHLIRHPGAFIRSAVMKGFHLNDSIWESGRVRMENMSEWLKHDQIEKLAWVWNTTNKFIIDFFDKIESERTMVVRLEDITGNLTLFDNILKFAGITDANLASQHLKDLDTKVNELVIHPNEPSNMRKVRSYPYYKSWTDSDKAKVHRLTGELSKIFDYDL